MVKVVWTVVWFAGLELVDEREPVDGETTVLVVPLVTGLLEEEEMVMVEVRELVDAETTLLVVPLVMGLLEEEEEEMMTEEVVPLTGTLLVEDDVVTGTVDVWLQPPLQDVIVRVDVVKEVTTTVVPEETKVLVRGQTVVEVKIVMSTVRVVGPAGVVMVELTAEEVDEDLMALLEVEFAEAEEEELIKLLLEVELRMGLTTEEVVTVPLP